MQMKTFDGVKRMAGLALAAVLLCGAVPLFGQNARLELKNLDSLSKKASEVTNVTLDGPMLQFAAQIMKASHDPDAEQALEVIKNLVGIYVKSFEFDQPGQYSQADVQAIRSQLAGPGWSRIVESRSEKDREIDEIFVMKQGDKIGGLAVLVAEPNELTVVNIVGPIDVEKLAALSGEFGIPKIHTHGEHSKGSGKPAKESTHEEE